MTGFLVAAFRVFYRLLLLPTTWAVILILVAGSGLAHWVSSMGGPQVFRERFGVVAPLITVPVHAIVAVTPFPSDVISVANAVLYGFWLGAALSWIGWWSGALAEYGLGRQARKEFELEIWLARVPRWLRQFPVGHPVFLIVSRQIPWLGGHVSTFVPGAYGVSLRRFAWCSAIAIIPGALVMAAIGAGLTMFQ